MVSYTVRADKKGRIDLSPVAEPGKFFIVQELTSGIVTLTPVNAYLLTEEDERNVRNGYADLTNNRVGNLPDEPTWRDK